MTAEAYAGDAASQGGTPIRYVTMAQATELYAPVGPSPGPRALALGKVRAPFLSWTRTKCRSLDLHAFKVS